jgi:hypothetical protein
VNYGIIFWGNTAHINKVFVLQITTTTTTTIIIIIIIIIIIMVVCPTYSYRGLFKHLGILPIPSVYLHSLMMFVVNNLYKFQLNNSVQGIRNTYTDR